MQIIVKEGPACPKCGGKEVLLGGPVRPFKFHHNDRDGWESNCTDCKIWFAEDGRITEDETGRLAP